MPQAIIYPHAVLTDVYSPAAKDGADGARIDTLVNAQLPVNGRTTAWVSGVMSVAAATVVVVVLLYDKDGACLGLAAPGEQTLTGGSTYKADADAADYEAPAKGWDLAGAYSYEVRSADPSSGTRRLRTWAV